MDIFPLYWPDEFQGVSQDEKLETIIKAVRLQDYNFAERILSALSISSHQKDLLRLLLSRIYLATSRFHSYCALSESLKPTLPAPLIDYFKYLQSVYFYKTKQTDLLQPFDHDWWSPTNQNSYTFSLYRIKLMVVLGYHDEALRVFNKCPSFVVESIEGDIIQCFLDIRRNMFVESFNRIRSSVSRFPQHEEAQALACELAILSRSNEYAVPVIRAAVSLFPSNPVILRAAVSIKFLQNLSADALYTCL